jgi:hypothetical protein
MNRSRWLVLAEISAVFASIMLYLWRWRYTAPAACIAIVGFIVLSQIWRKESAARLGFNWSNFRACAKAWTPAVLVLAVALLALGTIFATLRPIAFNQVLLALLLYCPWGLLQQYLLNSYFANRVLAIASARWTPLIAATVFSAAHLPNWFLMLVTLALGYCSTRIFLRYRNVYFLGLAHGLIGSVLWIVAPDSISHHLRVGPGFFTN